VVVRELDGPRQVSGSPKATAIEKAADSTEDKGEHQANGEDVEVTANGELVIPEIKKDDGDGQEDTSQELDAAPPNSKDGKQVALKLVKIVDYKEEACSHHPGYQRIEGCVSNKLGVRRDISAEAPYYPDGQEKADNHHQAVARYGQMNEGYLEKLRMHLFLTLSLVGGTSSKTGIVIR